LSFCFILAWDRGILIVLGAYDDVDYLDGNGSLTAHPRFGKTSKDILERIQKGEEAITSTLVLCEVAWGLEAMGRQGDIKPTLEKIMSYRTLVIVSYVPDDLLVGEIRRTIIAALVIFCC
jgi:hypothetical protein